MKRITPLLLCALLFSFDALTAQVRWEQLSGPEGGGVRSTAIAPDGSIYATIDRRGLFRSTDDGATWSRVAGLTLKSDDYARIFITRTGTLLLPRYQATAFRSSDGGATWDSLDVTLDWSVAPARDSSGGIIAVGKRELLRSTDDGLSWRRLGEPLQPDITALGIGSNGEIVLGLVPIGGAVGTSTDLGATWRVVNLGNDQTSAPTSIVALPDGRLLAAVPGEGFHQSSDVGATWIRLPLIPQRFYNILALRPDGRLLVATYDSLFVSDEAMTSLTPYGPPANTLSISTLVPLRDGRLLVGTQSAGFYVTSGDRWRRSSRGLPPEGIATLAASPDGTIYTIGWSQRLLSSTDVGETWTEPNEQAVEPPYFAVHPSGALFAAMYQYPRGGVRRSTDRGMTWTGTGDSIATEVVVGLYVGPSGTVYAGVDRGEESFFSSTTDGLFRTTDLGATWTTIGVGMERRTARHIAELADGTLLLATNHEVMRLDPGATTWVQRTSGLDTRGPINALVVDRLGNLFAPTSHGLYRSIDRGDSWHRVATTIPDSSFLALLALPDGRIVTATGDRGMWGSSNDGGDWLQLGDVPAPLGFSALMIDSAGHIFAGSPEFGIFRLEGSFGAVPPDAPSIGRLAIHPNPATSAATVTVTLASPSDVGVSIHAIDGGRVMSIAPQSVSAGTHRLTIDPSELPAGTYVVRVESATWSQEGTLVVVR
jgi:photosystem II stability/assembly factor-like uncharacterized protein